MTTYPAPGRLATGSVPEPDLEELRELVAAETELGDHPHAVEVRSNIPVYDGKQLVAALRTIEASGSDVEAARSALRAEWGAVLGDGAGILVVTGAFDIDVVDRVTTALTALVERQRAAGGASGDHFAKPGANDRVWNALEKLAVDDAEAFVDYYGNEMLALASESWLGPAYQVTSQVNAVNPGGAAQTVHRDYHLGFLTEEVAARYPAHVHRLSPLLTLQGAVAHVDMPVETGPSRYLPHSQKLLSGYLAWQRPEFAAYFEERQVQLPLSKGDAVFFNPAVFHAAGTNRSTDVRRMANLLQVSSAFGRAMESVDRRRVVSAIYPSLLRLHQEAQSRPGPPPLAGWARRRDPRIDPRLNNAIAAAAEGYPFPTDLDLDPPVEGLAPASQADLVREALASESTSEELAVRLQEYADRRGADQGSTRVTAKE